MGRSDSSSEDRRDRKRRRKEKKKKKSKKRSRRDDDSNEDRPRRKRDRKRDDDSNRKRRKKARKRDKYDSYSSDTTLSSIDRKRHKKERKRDRKKTKSKDDPFARNHALAQALTELLEHHPEMSEDLPIMLIRMVSGTTFDLSAMPNRNTSHALAVVFESLTSFGVQTNESGAWKWINPGGASSTTTDELVLVKIVRALLDQIGLSMEAIDEWEQPSESSSEPEEEVEDSATILKPDEQRAQQQQAELQRQRIGRETIQLIQNCQGGIQLAGELAALCKVVLEGEVIALDGLPDENLRTALEELFTNAGLVKSEMADSDDEEAGDNNVGDEATFGYGLPEQDNDDSKTALTHVLNVCSDPSKFKQRLIRGPMRPGQAELEMDSSEDEGPMLAGMSRREPVAIAPVKQEGTREEWMLEPGKYDFLGAVKAGQPLRSRGFQGKSNKLDDPEPSIDPNVQQEIRSIWAAHEEARGPSLLEQHRLQKKQERAQKTDEKWKWDRDKDLDAGRRVDTNNLKQIMNSGSELKSKFQSGT